MKKFQPRFFPPLLAETQNTFRPNVFFNAASRLWDGVFAMPEALRKLFPEPPASLKPEDGRRKETGEKRFKRRQKVQVEVLAYPLRPRASDIPLRGDLKNLSKNGVCVEFLKTVEENHLFLLDFQLPEEKSVRLTGRVIWCRNRLSGFELLDASDAKKILKETLSA